MNESVTRSEVYARFAPRLHAYARRFVDSTLADDIVQEVFLRVLAYKDGRVDRLPLQFLLTMTRNVALTMLASRRRASAICVRAGAHEAASEMMSELPRVAEILSRLPDRQRDAIELTSVHGLTEHQAARAMNASRSAVSQRKHAALDHLRRIAGAESRASEGSCRRGSAGSRIAGRCEETPRAMAS